MFKCPNTECAIHLKDKDFKEKGDCPLCDTPLVMEQSLSQFQQEVLDQYPYVIAFPFKRMLEDPAGRNQLELLAYCLVNVLKYLGLISASEYFHSGIKSPVLNTLFRNNLYQPSVGNWNQFIRESIKELKHHSYPFVFPELLLAYEMIETGCKVKKYKTQSEYTNDLGQVAWRDSNGTAIGTLINFRNKYLGHGVPLSNQEYTDLYQQHYPILEDLLQGIAPIAEIPMLKSERFHVFSLMSTSVHELIGVAVPSGVDKGDIWLQKDQRILSLLPFYVLPGSFADRTGKSEVFVYEQNTSSRLVFYSPESIKAESEGEVLERLNLLLSDKEKEAPLLKDALSLETIQERIGQYNLKTRNGLIKERKVIEGIYQSRQEAETELKSWVGAQAGLLFVSAQAGSGKTNLLNFIQGLYQERDYQALFIRASRVQSHNLEKIIQEVLHLEDAIELKDLLSFFSQSNPLILLIDGGNEHPNSLAFLDSVVATLQKYSGGALKVVLTWRATTLSDLPVLSDLGSELYTSIVNNSQENLPAKHALILTPLDRKELELAWESYVAHPSKKYKPQFNLSELTIKDRPLSEQLSNPLLLRMFLELFNNRPLKYKGEGFTDIWVLWWKNLAQQEKETNFLKHLALLLIEKNQLQIPLDELYTHTLLGKDVENIQVDSPFQQLVNKGELTLYFKEQLLMVSFTMEAAYHYTLCQVLIEKQTSKEDIIELLNGEQNWTEAVRNYLIHLVKIGKPELLYQLIEETEIATEILAAPLAEAILKIDTQLLLDNLIKQNSEREWKILGSSIKIIEDAQQKIKIQGKANTLFKKAEIAGIVAFELLLDIFNYLDAERKNKFIELFEESIKKKKVNIELDLYEKIGYVYYKTANYDKALKYNKISLEIKLKTLGPEHPKVAMAYNEIGLVYKHKIKRNDPIHNYEKSLNIRLKAFGLDHPSVAESYNNIGVLLSNKGDYLKAMEYLEKSLAIRLKTLGLDHSDVANSFNNIGVLLRKKGNHEKALEYHEKSLEIKLNLLGQKHIDVSLSYNNIGSAYNNKSNYEEALIYYGKSLAIRLELLGLKHPKVRQSYINIASNYREKGDYKKAIKHFKLAFIIKKEGWIAFNISNCYENLLEYQKALALYIESAELRKIDLGIEDVNTCESVASAKRIAIQINKENELPDWIKNK